MSKCGYPPPPPPECNWSEKWRMKNFSGRKGRLMMTPSNWTRPYQMVPGGWNNSPGTTITRKSHPRTYWVNRHRDNRRRPCNAILIYGGGARDGKAQRHESRINDVPVAVLSTLKLLLLLLSPFSPLLHLLLLARFIGGIVVEEE